MTKFLFVIALFAFAPVALLSSDLTYSYLKDRIEIIVDFAEDIPQYSNEVPTLSGEYSIPHLNGDIHVYDEINLQFTLGPEVELSYEFGPALDYKCRLDISPAPNPYVVLKELGIVRGLPVSSVRINPFAYNPANKTWKIHKTCKIILSNTGISSDNLSNEKLPHTDIDPFYSNVVNKEYIGRLLAKPNQLKNSSPTLQNEKVWYDKSVQYLKLTTKKEGIAKVDASEIFTIYPEWEGISTSKLHLLHMGNEQPLYIAGDDNGLLDSGDKLLFIGSRAKADTTWYDAYTTEAPYFLFSNSDDGLRFNEFAQPSSTVQDVKRVQIDMHIEKDSSFYYGYDGILHSSWKVAGEDWYWKMLTPETADTNDRLFTIDLPVVPIEGQELLLKSRTVSMFDDAEPNRHNFWTILNGDTLDKLMAPGRSESIVTLQLESGQLLAGLNTYTFRTMGIYNEYKQLQRPDLARFDYLNISGNAAPQAVFGVGDFYVAEQVQNSRLIIPGFGNEKVYIINKYDNSIALPQAEAGYYIKAGSRGSTGYKSIVVNDSVIYQGHTSEYILATSQDAGVSFQVTGSDKDNAIINKLNSLGQDDIFILLTGSSVEMGNNLIEKIEEMGNGQIEKPDAGSICAISGLVGSGLHSACSEAYASLAAFHISAVGNGYRAAVNLSAGESYHLLASSENALESALVYPVSTSDLRNTDNHADMLFVTHHDFMQQALDHAAYREQKDGYQCQVVDVDDIYKEFDYGRKSVYAIRDYISFVYHNYQQPAPRFLVIYGDASWDPRQVNDNSVCKDYVPTFGMPVSDYWYTLVDGDDYLGDLSVGRVPVDDSTEARNYLDKLIESEAVSLQPWMKRFLFLSGGSDSEEVERYRDFTYSMAPSILNQPLCADTAMVARSTVVITGEAESDMIIRKINNGAIWTNYLGHGSPEVYDMDGWYAKYLNNKGKYGALTSLSCNSGAFAEPHIVSRTEEYLRARDKGFMIVFSSTSSNKLLVDETLFDSMIKMVTKEEHKKRIWGDIVTSAKIRNAGDGAYLNSMMQFTLFGDPAARLRIASEPDLYIPENSLKVSVAGQERAPNEQDSIITLNATVHNAGITLDEPVDILLVHTYNSVADTQKINLSSVCLKQDIEFSYNIYGKPGNHDYRLVIDPEQLINDIDYDNNEIQISSEVFNIGPIRLDPFDYWNICASQPEFRVINQLMGEGIEYDFRIYDSPDTNATLIYEMLDGELTEKENYLQWLPDIEFEAGTHYWLACRNTHSNGEMKSSWLWVPFHTLEPALSDTVTWSIGSGPEFSRLVSEGADSLELGRGIFTLGDKHLHVELASAFGNADVKRHCLVRIDNSTYISSEISGAAPVGLNVARINKKDLSFIASKRFDTWEGPTAHTDFISYLRDTISTDEIMMVVACGASFRMFNKAGDGPGNFADLKETLRLYGAVLGDNIIEGSSVVPNSYYLAGSKGTEPVRYMEAHDSLGYRVQEKDTIVLPRENGRIEFPIVGPASKWHDMNINMIEKGSNTFTLLAMKDIRDSEEVIFQTNNPDDISVDEINTDKYKFIKLRVDTRRKEKEQGTVIDGLNVRYKPLPELAFKQGTSVLIGEIMRGDSLGLKYETENISPRVAAGQSVVSIYKTGESGAVEEFAYNHPWLPEDHSYDSIAFFNTQFFEHNSEFELKLNEDKSIDEYYYFNNSANTFVNLYEDSVKPWVEIELDGVPIYDSITVSMSPHLTIRLMDNSRLPVDEKSIKVWLNSRIICNEIPDSCSFDSYDYDIPLKAMKTINIDTIVYRHNLLFVSFSDGTKNRDTLIYNIFTSINRYIDNLSNYPNPFADGTTIGFDYKSPEQGDKARLQVYNLSGQLINKQEKPLIIGRNEFMWDGRDLGGNSCPTGMYFYRVSIINTDSWAQPRSGKCLLVR